MGDVVQREEGRGTAGNGRWPGGGGEASAVGAAPQREKFQAGNGSCRVEVTAVHSSIEGRGIGGEWEVSGRR